MPDTRVTGKRSGRFRFSSGNPVHLPRCLGRNALQCFRRKQWSVPFRSSDTHIFESVLYYTIEKYDLESDFDAFVVVQGPEAPLQLGQHEGLRRVGEPA